MTGASKTDSKSPLALTSEMDSPSWVSVGIVSYQEIHDFAFIISSKLNSLPVTCTQEHVAPVN